MCDEKKKIMIIGMDFYDYERKIIEGIKRRGYEVDYMCDSSPRYGVVKRIFGNKVSTYWNALYQKKRLKNCHLNYELIIVIVGRHLTVDFIRTLKKRNPNCKLILYLWDDVERVENFNFVYSYYDKIYSFDPIDCNNKGFEHLPLFYTEKGRCYKFSKKYDIYSAMFSHSDRLRIVETVVEQAKNNGRQCLFFVCLGYFGYMILKLRETIKNKTRKYKKENIIIYAGRPIDKMRNYKYMNQSKAVLDIQFSSQIGLTMRSIECIGMGVKLITTNTSIRKYDFYNENNILIIDRENPIIDWDFLDKQYEEIEEKIYEKYSLKNWIDVILTDKKEVYMIVEK